MLDLVHMPNRPDTSHSEGVNDVFRSQLALLPNRKPAHKLSKAKVIATASELQSHVSRSASQRTSCFRDCLLSGNG